MRHLSMLIGSYCVLIVLNMCTSLNTEARYPDPRDVYPLASVYTQDTLNGPDTTVTSLSLQNALFLSSQYNPDIQAARHAVTRAEGVALQASLRPNPELELEHEARTVGYESTLQLGQLIELGGKRMKRTELATREADLSAMEYELTRLDILTATAEAFITVLSMQETVGLNSELANIAREFNTIVDERVAAGIATQAEAARARIVLSRSRIQLDQANRELRAAREALRTYWGESTLSFESVAGDLETIYPLPESDTLISSIQNAPALERTEHVIARAQSNVYLQRTLRIPSPVVRGGTKQEADASAVVLGISIPLTFFDRNQGGIQSAQAEMAQAVSNKEAVSQHLAREVTELVTQVEMLTEEIRVLREQIVPDARLAFETLENGYQQGRFTFLDVLEAQRTLFDSRLQQIQLLSEYHQSINRLEGLLGQPIQHLSQ